MSARRRPHAPRIVLHAINGVGLGHLMRLLTVAREIALLEPAAAILFLAHARNAELIAEAGFDYVGLPPRLGDPHVDPDRVLAGLPEALDDAVMVGALRAFRPDLVLFDTHAPVAVVEAATATGARTVLLLRELRPEALDKLWRSYTAWSFDRILVPHEPDEFDVSLAPEELPIERIGPVVRELPTKLASPSAKRAAGELFVVATAGGGGQPIDAERYLDAVASAHERLRAELPKLCTVLVSGPYHPRRAGGARVPGLRIERRVPRLVELLARADVVVSQAGYNAVAELRRLRKPMVLVPGERKMEDQSARAARLSAIGAALLAKPTARSVGAALGALLRSPERRAAMTDAHATRPLVPRNREVAEAALRPLGPRNSEVRRVALVAHDFAPAIGGMQTMASELARALGRRGIEVVVYASLRSLPSGSEPHAGVRVRALYPPLPGPRPIDLLGDLLLTVGRALGDAPDVIHLGHAGLGPWVPALRAAWPCVVTASVHGNDLLDPWVHHGGDERAYRLALIEGLARSDGVFPVSSFSRKLARDAGVPAARLRTVPNGVDPERFRPGPWPSELARRLGVGPEDEVLLLVSRLAPRKGHRTVIRALPQILADRPRAKLLFTGVNAELGAELAALAQSLGVAEQVRPVGRIAAEDLADLYRLATLFVMAPDGPTDKDVEGFGIAVLEAAATGLPIVASRTGGLPEATGEAALLVAPEDPNALATAAVALLSDRARAAALGALARARVEERHGWDAIAGQLVEHWSQALARLTCTESLPLGGGSTSTADRASARGVRSADGGPARNASGTECPPLGPLGLGPLLAGRAQSHHSRVLAARSSLRRIDHGAALAKLARLELRARRAERVERQDRLRRLVERGRIVRLRATRDTGWRLVEALLDCRAVGHAPDVELKLTSFLLPELRAAVVPHVRGLKLLAGLPFEPGSETLERLRAVGDAELRVVRALGLYLAPEATEGTAPWRDAVLQAHALRRELGARGVTTVPPPELMRYLSMTPSPGPATAMIEPCNRCNLGCPTCPVGQGRIAPAPDLARESFAHLLEQLRPALRNLALWNYGEPTLHADLAGLVAEAKARGVGVVKTSTNGTKLAGPMGLELLRSGLDVLIVSVDGASQETYQQFRRRGDFDHVASGIARMCEAKRALGLERPSIELQFIAMSHNQHELERVRELAARWGVDRLRIKTVGVDAEHRDLLPSTPGLSRYGPDGRPLEPARLCTLPWDHTVIHVDGSVTPCCYLRPDMGRELVMGNALETPFAAIWRGARYQGFRLAMLERRHELPVCKDCRGSMEGLFVAIEEPVQ